MDTVIKKDKAQSFFEWLSDTLRSNQRSVWKQVGLWSVLVSVLVIVSGQ